MSETVHLFLGLRGGATKEVRVRASAASRLVKVLAETGSDDAKFLIDTDGVIVRIAAIDSVASPDDDWRDRVLEAAQAVPTL